MRSAKDYKTLPNSIEAERAVLGGCVIDSTAFEKVSSTAGLTSDDFYFPVHKDIFNAMSEISKSLIPIDIITLMDVLTLNNKNLESAGGMSYIATIVEETPTAANVVYYARIVKETAVKRNIVSVASDLIAGVYDDKEADFLLEKAQKELSNTATATTLPLAHAKETAIEVLESLQELSKAAKGVVGVPTGFASLDGYLGGFQDTDLIIVAGRPSMGKELTLDSDILMSTGKFKKMGEMQVGDEVASVDGEKSVVTGVYPQGKRAMYEVVFSDGRRVEAGLSHQWSVLSDSWSGERIMTTQDVIDFIGTKSGISKLRLPAHSGDFGVDSLLKIDPHMLGMLMGYEIQADRDYDEIPLRYLSSTRSFRLELIRGIMDVGGKVAEGVLSFSAHNLGIAESIQRLGRSLGANVEIIKDADTYNLFITGDICRDFCSTLEGVESIKKVEGLSFVSVKYAGDKESQCIAVSHPRSLYFTNDYIVTHNTAFSVQIATHIAFNEKAKVGVFSIEVGRKQLIKNIMACQARVSTDKFKTAGFNESDWGKIGKVTTDIAMSNLYVDEVSRSSLAIARQARRMKIEHGLDIIFIDHLQQMHEDGRSENRNLEIGKMTGNLKDLAKELDIPVVLVSQINRGVTGRDNKVPTMADLSGSGSIEQDADVVIFIHRDEYYTGGKSLEPGRADVVIAKQRNGLTGNLKLEWTAHYVRFDDMTQY